MATCSNDRGAIMMFVMGMLLTLLLVAAASALFTRTDERLSINRRDASRALFIAEGGLEWAHNQVRGDNASLYLDGSSTVSQVVRSFGGGTFTVDVSSRDLLGRRRVTSSGSMLGTSRSLSATLQRFALDPASASDCLFPGDADGDGICDSKLGLVGRQSVVIGANAVLDSFRGDSTVYGAATAKHHGNVATNGDLTLSGSGAVIRGGVYVGRNLSTGVGNTLEQGKTVLPTLYPPPLPSFDSVCASNANPTLVDCNPPFGVLTTVLAGSPPNQTLTVSAGQAVCMLPGTYCFRQVVVGAGGTLRFVDNPSTGTLTAQVILQLDGSAGPSLTVTGRLDYGTGARPNLVKAYARGDVEIDGWSGSAVYGLLYAPTATVLLGANGLGNSMDFYGVVIGDRVSLGPSPVAFHVDEDAMFGDFCTDPTSPSCKPAFVIRDEWSENRG